MNVETVKTLISALSVAVAAASVVWAVMKEQENQELQRQKLQYEQRQASVEQTLSLKRPFYEIQLDLCVAAADAAGSYATAHDEGKAAGARDRFDELYHGSLVLVEDRDVAGAMIDYRRQMLALGSESLADRRRLASAALAVSNACRELIERSWTLDLPSLRDLGG